jgi:hypothetical protein
MPLVELEDDDGTVTEVEVPHDAIEVQDGEDLVYQKQSEFDDTLQSRLNRKERNLRSQLKDDDDFWQEAAAARGVELRDDGKPKGSISDDEIEELKRKASKVDSLEEEVSSYEETLEKNRRKRLEQELLDQAPPAANETARDTFVREAQDRMTYDDEYGWVKTEGDDIAYEAGEPQGPESVIDELEDSHGFLFEDTEVSGGSDVQPGSSGSTLTQSQFEKEVQKAQQEKDLERMQELEQKEANGEVIAD